MADGLITLNDDKALAKKGNGYVLCRTSGCLSTMGGVAQIMELLSRQHITDVGSWMSPAFFLCRPKQLAALVEILDEHCRSIGMTEKGAIVTVEIDTHRAKALRLKD